MKRETFKRLAQRLGDNLLQKVAKSEIYWDRVDSIKEGRPEPLYDLSTTSSNFVANGIIAHNTSDQRSLVEDAFRDRIVKVVCATPTLAAGVNTPSRRVIVRDWRRYDSSKGGMAPLSTLEVHQMFGRAGRPGYDDYGEAVLLAGGRDEYEELFDRYIYAEPEPVRSKLAAEPALRTHVLATVATGFARSREGLLEFLDETLYASQSSNRDHLLAVIDGVLEYLERNGFLTSADGRFAATSIGETVSRLYLDPMSAAIIINGLSDVSDPSAFGLYHLISRTPDMYELYLRSGDRETFTGIAHERDSELLGRSPSEFENEWEDWLSALKTAKLLEDWSTELDEDRLTNRYGVGPGDIRGKVDTAEWLLNAAGRLASECDLSSTGSIRAARRRVQHGVRAELLELVGVRGVGRVRARQLYDAGIESPAALREVDKQLVLAALGGQRQTVENILRNAGRRDPSMSEVSEPVPTPGSGQDESSEEEQAGLGDFT